MKRLITTMVISLLAISAMYAQQWPLNENYYVNKYSLSSAYAGNSENKNVFLSYRRDWTGVANAPSTIRLSYHDGFKSNAGIGGKLIMDRIGIFKNFYGMATYSYKLESTKQKILFGLSLGLNQTSIDFTDYYADPNFDLDPALINSDVNSKAKFISDLSVIYIQGNLHTGVMLSNISFGDYNFEDAETEYNPFINFQYHALYTVPLKERWVLTPSVIFRGGKHFRNKFEIGSQIEYNDKFWGNLALRGKDIICVGFGLNAGEQIIVNYSYNFSTNIAVNTFQNHELTVGLNLAAFSKESKESFNEKTALNF